VPRTYGDRLLIGLQQADGSLLGVRLGRLCVEANLPASYVSKALGVGRTTIHLWFRGQPMRESKHKTVESFMYLVEQGMQNGLLPAKNVKEAKTFLEGMIGNS